MAQKNRANMLTDIVTNIFNNIINYITGQNAQDRFVNLLDSTPNILSDKDQADGYVGTDVNNEMVSEYYNEFISRADMISKLTANEAVGFKFYQINDAVSGARIIQVVADSNISLYSIGLDVATGETGTYDINTDVFTPIVVSGTPTLSQVLTAGNTSGANDIEFDAAQGLLFANTSRLREGTIDAGLGGAKGIAQICAVGYELKWEAGRLYVMDGYGTTIRLSLYNFSTPPTVTDDNTKGYAGNSLWTLDDGSIYVCTNPATGAAVWVQQSSTPTLQQVTDAGFTTTNKLISDDGAGNTSVLNNGVIELTTGLQNVIIDAALVTTAYNVSFPDKITGAETFAMLSDITGGGTVTSVNAGTNITVTGTATDPIINSLADRYSTSSVTSNTISNGAKTFTVDANLAYIPLQEVLIVNDPSNHMHATVTSYSGTTLVVDVKTNTGSGTFTSWVLNLDGTPVDAITGVGTANEIAYFTAGQVIASLPVATYPSLTELSYVKGVTSAIQTQLNTKVTAFASATDGTANGVLSIANTISISVLIPANTFALDDVIRINHRVRATGTAAIRETRVYANTTSSLTGAILVSTATLASTILAANTQRFLAIKNATTNTEVVTATTSLLSDYNSVATAVTTLAINWTADVYIIFAVNATGTGADSIRATMYSIEKL